MGSRADVCVTSQIYEVCWNEYICHALIRVEDLTLCPTFLSVALTKHLRDRKYALGFNSRLYLSFQGNQHDGLEAAGLLTSMVKSKEEILKSPSPFVPASFMLT